MDEIFNFIMRRVVRLSIWIGTLLGAGLQHIILWFMHRSGERAPAPISQAQKDENAQLAGCRDVVLSIAKRMGFIAREAISWRSLNSSLTTVFHLMLFGRRFTPE